jgi:hypothetical protein
VNLEDERYKPLQVTDHENPTGVRRGCTSGPAFLYAEVSVVRMHYPGRERHDEHLIPPLVLIYRCIVINVCGVEQGSGRGGWVVYRSSAFFSPTDCNVLCLLRESAKRAIKAVEKGSFGEKVPQDVVNEAGIQTLGVR